MRKLVSEQYRLVFLASALITLLHNGAFFSKLAEAFPPSRGNVPFIMAAGVLLFLVTTLALSIGAGKYTTKPLLIVALMTGALCNYFMSTYGTVVDPTMLRNLSQTDSAEAAGLVNPGLIMNVVLLGIVPSWFICRSRVAYLSIGWELMSKLSVMVLVMASAGLLALAFSAHLASLFREYKPVRYYANPITAFYSGAKFLHQLHGDAPRPDHPERVSTDARIVDAEADAGYDHPDRELVVMVIGETARSDHFQLNGYGRATNPRLATLESLVSFRNVTSCGTSTAVSVPCMFSKFKRSGFDGEDIYTHENALDVLQRNGVNILWRDNNSSSKGVAARVDYENFRDPAVNPICDPECRDEGMLSGLQAYVDSHPDGDILIILHQMGSHGPEYYKRYPPRFEHFEPACKTNKLNECSAEEINNAYDNTILYTDYFLSKVVELVEQNEDHFEAAMFYISDHGESLGEAGLYLHGLPYSFAPESQKQVAAVMWAGRHFDVPAGRIERNKDKAYSHDHVYCTLLGMFEVATEDCSSNETMF